MKTATRLIAALSAFATAATFSAAANATVFAIDYHDKGVWNAYDLENEAYALSFRADQGNDGFWLVVTDGGNPKGDGSSHAILYGDIKNDRITAYTYDGKNSEKSFATGTLLGTYENAFTDGGTHMKYGYDLTNFSLDVSGLNNALGPDFDGVVLGPDAGIWFHQSTGSEFTYGADGSITDYVFDNQTLNSLIRVVPLRSRVASFHQSAQASCHQSAQATVDHQQAVARPAVARFRLLVASP